MVIQDPKFIQTESAPTLSQPHELRLASVADRLLAFAIDFFLFSPVIHLVLSILLRKIEVLRVSDPDSLELMSLIFVALALAAAIVIILQSAFLAFWGGTPGKLMLKLRVVSTAGPDEALSLRWSQALLRSVLWVVEVVLLMIPFLEILSHRSRKALHDRGAETVVITLKQKGDAGPHPLEVNFIRQALAICTLFVATWISFGVGRAYHLSSTGAFKKGELSESGLLCTWVDEDSKNRIDEALSLFLADAVTDECVLLEADFAMWSADSSQKPWASLAMAVVSRNDSKLSQAYLDKVCADKVLLQEDSEPCRLSLEIEGAVQSENQISHRTSVNSKNNRSMTSRVLAILNNERQSRFETMAEDLEQLQHRAFGPFKIQHQLRALWAQHSFEKARGLYQGALLTLNDSSSNEISAWMCLEELQQTCTPGGQPQSCRDLRAHHEGPITSDLEMAWALIKTKSCEQTREPILADFRNLFEKRKDFRKLAETLLNENGLSPEQQVEHFASLSQSGSVAVRKWALSEWIERAQNKDSWKKIFSILSAAERRDWVWQKQNLRAIQRTLAQHEDDYGRSFAKLVGGSALETWGLQSQVRALETKPKRVPASVPRTSP